MVLGRSFNLKTGLSLTMITVVDIVVFVPEFFFNINFRNDSFSEITSNLKSLNTPLNLQIQPIPH